MNASLLLASAATAIALAPAGFAQSAPPASNPTAQADVVQLDRYVVESFRREYVAPVTTTGLGLDADVMSTPLTVFSVPMDILTDQQVNNVEDALRNVAGVSKFKQGNGGEEKFSLRGFDAAQNLYKDGARINNRLNATNIATTETANIERYDVLKGPAAILYGQGEPGGVINYVTKKPLFKPYRSIEAIAGSYDYYRGELDVSGPLTDAFAYRLITSYENSGSHRDHTFRDRLLVAPSLTWRLSPRTQVTAQVEYISDTYTQDRGQVLDGDNVTGFTYSSRLSPEQFFGAPGHNENTESDYRRAAVLASHRVSNAYTIELFASATRVEKDLRDTGARNAFANQRIVAANGDVSIGVSGQGGEGDSETVTFNHKLAFDGTLFGQKITHRILLGADYERIANLAKNFTANVPTITYNVFTRAYTGLPAGGFTLTQSSQSFTAFDQYGLVAQDLISFGEKWHALLGARFTRYEDRTANVTAKDTSPRTGLVYRANRDLMFYASYGVGFVPTTARGFNPATGTGINGPVLDPETSEQFEVGARWQLFNEGVILNFAAFDLAKDNVPVTDPASLLRPDGTSRPAGEQWSANLGETRTRGFEVQAVGRITKSLRLIAGYAYLDNELVRANPLDTTTRAGAVLPGIPLHSGNAWAVYEFQQGALKGLGFGAGVFAQSDIFASTENRARYNGWLQTDAMLYYKRDRWKFQVNAKNLTDETYNLAQALTTTDSFAGIRVGTSTPRTFTASLAWEF